MTEFITEMLTLREEQEETFQNEFYTYLKECKHLTFIQNSENEDLINRKYKITHVSKNYNLDEEGFDLQLKSIDNLKEKDYVDEIINLKLPLSSTEYSFYNFGNIYINYTPLALIKKVREKELDLYESIEYIKYGLNLS